MGALAKIGFREMRKRPGRAALTLASVVIGVAAVVSVTLTIQATRTSFKDIYESMAGRADLEVAAFYGSTFSEDLLKVVDETPGVAAAAPIIQRPIKFLRTGKRAMLTTLMGIDPERDKAIHNYQVVAGDPLGTQRDSVIVNSEFASNLNLKVGDKITIGIAAHTEKPRIVGLFKSGTTAISGQAANIVTTLRSAQAWAKAPSKLDSIQIVLKERGDLKKVQDTLMEKMPAGAQVRPPAARSKMAEETALATETALQMARTCALIVAVFVIANTFLISVTQRRRQFGIMRAIGATRGQIAGSVFRQALMLGFAGTILGCIVGVFAANYLNQAMGVLYETSLPNVQLSAAPFIWAFVFGVGISLVGAALPSYKAAHLSPLDAMRDVLAEEIEGVSQLFTIAGLTLIVFGGAVMAASIFGNIGPTHAVWSSVILLIGLMLLLPLALEPLTRAVAALAPRNMRVESRVASRHLLIHRSRTTLTVGIVFLATAVVLALANTIFDNVNNVKTWYKKTIIADFIVRSCAPDMATGMSSGLSDEVGEKIKAIPGVLNIDAIRLAKAEIHAVHRVKAEAETETKTEPEAEGQEALLISRGFNDPELFEFDLVTGEPKEVRDKLKAGEVVLGSVPAQRLNCKPGDEIRIDGSEGEKTFRIAAIANDYQAGGLTMYIDSAVALRELGIGGADAYTVKAEKDKLVEVRKALDEMSEDFGDLLIQSASDIRNEIDRMMAAVDGGLWGLVVLVLMVAMFGVANTLTMTVIEQTFELGLLRIVAATRAQVRKLIFAQALVMGILALVPALVAGVTIAYLIHLATMTVIGHPVAFEFHPWMLVAALVGGLAVIFLAAWPPAERAARIELPATLKLR